MTVTRQGRKPYRDREKAREVILEALRKGHSIRAAAKLAGYTGQSIAQNWAKDDPEWAAKMKDAYEEGTGVWETKAKDVVMGTPTGEWNGAVSNTFMFMLKQRDTSYREHSQAVQINTKVEFRELDATKVRKILEQAGAFDVEGEIVDEPKELSETTGADIPRAAILPPSGDSE